MRKYFISSPVLSVPQNTSTTSTDSLPPISPTPSNADSQLDFLFKSLAKESLSGFNRDEKRNEINKLEGKP